jgi:hypothetical protein
MSKNQQKYVKQREEKISRGPTFGDFVTILTERSMQDNAVVRLQSKGKTPLPPLYQM